MAYFSSLAAIPSEPGARPFRSLVMALVTSDSEGSSVEAEASAAAEDDFVSGEAELVQGEWLSAVQSAPSSVTKPGLHSHMANHRLCLY